MNDFKKISSAAQLPQDWDKLAENYFQQRKFLLHTEKYNPCNQRYYLLFEENNLTAAAILYTLRLDIFTFSKLKSPLKMHIVGVPCSVSAQGIFGEERAVKLLKKHIFSEEKGFLLLLNLKNFPDEKNTAVGKTLPTILFKNQFAGWDNYVSALRSAYRRRMHFIHKPDKEISLQKMNCGQFTTEMYQQYLQVFNKSNGKLEKLTPDFFRNLPEEFILTTCKQNNDIIGWNLALEDKNTYYFFLGGIDYQKNKEKNTYLRLLFNLVKTGIEKNTVEIELGQTAEIAKMRMGGTPETLYMQAKHSNPVFNKILKIISPLLEYKRNPENTNAFKKEK